MSTLQRLAPSQPHRSSLLDYLYMTSYQLKMAVTPETELMESYVEKGPVEKPAHDIRPIRVSSDKHFAEGLATYAAGDLRVLNANESLTLQPSKVCTPDGTTCYFKSYGESSKSVETGEESNASTVSIQTYLQLHQLTVQKSGAYPAGVPQILGVVTDNDMVAGILLTYVAKARPLIVVIMHLTSVEQLADVESRIGEWQAQTRCIVSKIHRSGLSGLDGADACSLHAWNVLLDADDRVWLPLASGVSGAVDSEGGVPSFHDGVKRDYEAVERLYQNYLPNEIETVGAKLRTHSRSDISTGS